ncbi:MAG: hypothetical protein DME19_07165 [Verrucomicrobia bacterium]|nr:MAG: hypothetical protein DME19_07165 [Verrucomicrobiota bacterium]
MKSRSALLALLFVCDFSAGAFVVELNSNGDPVRWHLNPLEPTVPPNPKGQGVHTNVVNPATRSVRFFLAADAYSAANATTELNAVRASFAQWQAIPGTFLKFEDAGLVAPGVDVNTSDDQNVVFWAKNGTLVNGGMDNISGALAVTFNSFFPDNNAQAEADIVFNGVEYAWSADFNSADTTVQFIESTAAHEIGHFLGLKHSPVGGATMLFRGAAGVNLQAGLSSDEVAAAQWLYAQSSTLATLGRLQGQVTLSGSPVFGAAVLAEEASTGNLVAGTVTRADGAYDLPAMPPGQYRVRVTPLDPSSASSFLIRGRDIASAYASAETGFLPTTNVIVTLTAGATGNSNFAVTVGSPAFRITHIRQTSANAGSFRWSSLPAAIHPGQSNYFIGVASANLPTNESRFPSASRATPRPASAVLSRKAAPRSRMRTDSSKSRRWFPISTSTGSTTVSSANTFRCSRRRKPLRTPIQTATDSTIRRNTSPAPIRSTRCRC